MLLYDSIDDLPIYNYQKVIETNSLDWLIIEDQDMPVASKNKLLFQAWGKIEEEFYDLQLKDPDYVEHLKSERRHYEKKIKAFLSGKALDMTHYKLSAKRFEPENSKPFDFWESIALLRKQGYLIDPKKDCVRLYYTSIRMLKKESKR